jgi:predicted acylesterase/phospholipase RssA
MNTVDDPYKELIDADVLNLKESLAPEFNKFRALQRSGAEKLGGVCAGGGGKGWYDVGVTEFLYDIGFIDLFLERADNGMPAGELFGTSFGALWAAALARAGADKAKFQEAFFYIKSNESVYKGKIDMPNILWTGATNGPALLDNTPLKNRLIELFGERSRFSDQLIPARVTAFCIADDNDTKLTHDIVTFKGDDITWISALASASIPGAFRPVLYKGMLLIDGGVAANCPILYACENGCTRIAVLFCSPDTANNSTSKIKGVRDVLCDLPQGAMDAFEKYIHKGALAHLKLQAALGQCPASILTNEPDFDTLSALEFAANRWLRERGYRDAKKKFTREVILNMLFGPGGMVPL